MQLAQTPFEDKPIKYEAEDKAWASWSHRLSRYLLSNRPDQKEPTELDFLRTVLIYGGRKRSMPVHEKLNKIYMDYSFIHKKFLRRHTSHFLPVCFLLKLTSCAIVHCDFFKKAERNKRS